MPIRQRILPVLCAGAILAAACEPTPPPPPPPITGSPATGTGIQSVRAQIENGNWCTATTHSALELTGTTEVEGWSYVEKFGGTGCIPAAWVITIWMECVPGCGAKTYMYNGPPAGGWVTMRFVGSADYAHVYIHMDATYAGRGPTNGNQYQGSPLIRCGTTTNGQQACLFQGAGT
jgi:hypothetical protein